MTTHDPALDHLRDAATRTWDADAARTLMAHLAPDSSQLVTRDHLDLRLGVEAAGIRADMAGLRTELRGEMANLRTELHQGFATQTKWLVGTMIASVFAFGSLLAGAVAVVT